MKYIHKVAAFFHQFLNNPRQLFWFFILVNLIPSVCLVFTEPFSLLGKVILITFPTGIFLILLSLLKNTGLIQLILIPVLILHAFQLVLFYLFGESVIATDMFLNLATTNVSEANELLDNLWPSIILVCVIYIPTIVIAAIACKQKVHRTYKQRKTTLLAGIVVIAVSCGLIPFALNKNTGNFTLHQDVYPANVIYNLSFAIHKWQASNLYPITSKEFRFDAQKNSRAAKREVYVMVIGEASRANNWSLCGYERETNPQLAATQGIVLYKDAITQSNTTHKSVPLILSAASAEDFNVIYKQKSIIQAFKEAGFSTVFLSNQTPNRSFTDYFAEEADYYHNIRPASAGGIYTVNNFDEEMLPLYKHYLDSIPGDLFFVFHTYGSHFNYKERYPAGFSEFTPDSVTNVEVKNKQQLHNAYDNSIRYTDNFLAQLIGLLDTANSCSALFYTSDHGEDLLDDSRKRFLHASPNPTYYQLHIPIFIWFSGNYQTSFPQKVEAAILNETKPIATSAAFHTVLDMASIHTKVSNPTLSLVNPGFKTIPRMYLNDHDQPIFFYNAGLKKQDKEMIEKRGLQHNLP